MKRELFLFGVFATLSPLWLIAAALCYRSDGLVFCTIGVVLSIVSFTCSLVAAIAEFFSED